MEGGEGGEKDRALTMVSFPSRENNGPFLPFIDEILLNHSHLKNFRLSTDALHVMFVGDCSHKLDGTGNLSCFSVVDNG
jgi:hypothetical protein